MTESRPPPRRGPTPDRGRVRRRRATVLLLSRPEPEWRLVAATVQGDGYDLIETASLSEALDQVREAVPDVVLLPGDVQGLEFLDRIRDEEQWGLRPPSS